MSSISKSQLAQERVARRRPVSLRKTLARVGSGSRRVLLYIALVGGSILMAFPLLWMVNTSMKTLAEANAPKLVWWPAHPQITAYLDILANANFVRSYLNSIFVVVVAVTGTVLSISIVAYAFSRVEWPGRSVVFALMLSTLMIPLQTTLVPQYVLFNRIKWIGTFNPITIPGFFAGGAAMIFLLRQFMAQIPHELDEAAIIDGANHFQIWWYVIMPLTKPAIATITVMLFIGNWNSLQLPVIYLQTTSLQTLPVFVNTLINPTANTQPWPMVMAASVLTTLPLIIVFFFMQRYLIESIVLTGSKG